MTISISNESKNSLSVTNENKGVGQKTWDEMTETWDEIADIWNFQGATEITNESKNTISLTNQTKN